MFRRSPLAWLSLSSLTWLFSFGLGAIAWAETIPFTLLHFNDVYEIMPIAGGKWGGLARVATLRQRLKQENPHTYTVLAGDLLSPSALGTAQVKGERLAGKQMVAVLNQLGLDYATFGNHEFDLSETEFLQRLRESKFQWFSGNVTDKNGQPFPQVAPYLLLSIPGQAGGQVRVGVIGLTLNSNPANYVRYQEAIATARRQIQALAPQVDVWIAVTHLSLAQDQDLAAAIPELDLILGGHEHENIQRGYLFVKNERPDCPRAMTPIFKADANVKTVYIHRLTYDTEKRCLQIQSQLQPITEHLPDDPATAEVAQYWQSLGFQAFRQSGFDPQEIIAYSPVVLNALDADVRSRSTNLTQLIGRAMLQESEADLAIFNGGMIRLDDMISPGAISQYDVIRLLPFGNRMVTVTMTGELLQKVLTQGSANQGTGGYLHWAGLNPQTLQPKGIYRVVIPDFLLTGKEVGLSFLNRQSPGLVVLKEQRDLRHVLVDYLKKVGQQAFEGLVQR